VRRELAVDAGERRGVGQPHVVAEHRDRLRERGRLGGSRDEPEVDRARDSFGPSS
jgi:hypothetical protein